MMKNSASDQPGTTYLIVHACRVTCVSDGFAELTGFAENDISGGGIDDILSMLRLTHGARGLLESYGAAQCWLFTKGLEPREVIVSRQLNINNDTYVFEEKPHSRLEEILAYPCQLLEENTVGVSIYSALDFTLLKANKSYLNIFDEPYRCPENAVGKTVHELIEGYSGSEAEFFINNAFATGKSAVFEELPVDIFKRGVTYWDQLVTPVKADGEIKYIVTTTQEVTERVEARKENEDALKKSEASLRSVLDHSGDDFIYSLNMLTNTYEYISPCAFEVLGCTAEQFISTDVETFHESVHPDDQYLIEATPAVMEANSETEIRFRQRVKNGEYRWFSNHLTDVKDEEGRVLFRNGRIRDITEQVESDEVIQYQANLLKNISDIVISTDENFRIRSWNKAAELTYGWTEEEAAGQQLGKLLQSQFGGSTNDETVSRLNQEDSFEVEVIQTCKDGRKLIVLGSPHVIRDNNGNNTGSIGIFRDITDRKKMEVAIAKSEALLRAVLENSGDLTYCYNTQTQTYEFVSAGCKKVLGFTPEEMMTMDLDTIHMMVHPEDMHIFGKKLDRQLQEEGLAEITYRQQKKSGEYRWISNHLSVICDTEGRILYRNGRIRDITEQMKSDEVIRYQASLLQNISDMVISTDENLYIRSWNKAAELTYGWTEAEAAGQHLVELLQMQVVDSAFDDTVSRLIWQGSGEVEVVQTSRDGRKLNVLSTPHTVKDGNGIITGYIGIFRDITDRKKIEDALREREMHLRLAAKGAKLGTYAFDLLKGTVFISEELKTLWGLQPDEPIPFGDDNLFFKGLHPDDKELFLEKIAVSDDPGGDGLIELDYRILLSDGAVRWLHVRGQTNFGDVAGIRQPVFAAGVVIDITERVTAENSVREISEELRNIIDSTEDFIGSVDRDYRIILYNSAWSDYMEHRFGCRLEKGARLMDLIPPQYAAVWSELFERTISEGKYQIELKIDEGTRVMSYSFNPVYIDGQVAEMTVFGKEVTDRLNSEREIIQLNSSLEKRVLERTEELQKSISDLRNLSNIISHDLKGPIRLIEHHAKHIKTLTQSGDFGADISEIEKTCARMTRLIVSLSEYAMSSELKIKKEDVNVRKMVTAIYNELKAGALNGTLLQFESGMPVVYADRVLLQHVLSNLLSNALKFSSKREISEITAGCMEDNGQYVFYIRDNGVGFDMQYAHKLFNVFERLHADEGYEGSGIGLAAVRNIVRRHGGITWIESKENAGTTVYFTLPVETDKGTVSLACGDESGT